MSLFVAIFFFTLGAIIASFVGVIAVRLNTGQSCLSGRSLCDACGSELSSGSLVPIVSYLVMRGRARCCGARLSLYSPIAEVVLGSLFVLVYLKIGFVIALPFALLSLSLLLALVLYDLAHHILPSSLLYTFIVSGAATGFFSASTDEFFMSMLVALLLAAFLAAIHFLSRGRFMGFADAPLVFGLALFAGHTAFSGFVFSFWVGAVIGIIILACRPRGHRMGVEVPFAPFLAAGFLIAYFTKWNIFYIVAILLAY